MQITFDPHNPEECATIARLLGTTAQPDTATAQPETAPAQPETAPAQPDTAQPETDCHGMTHDDAIHSTPASKNADGSWRAKRGQFDADAQILAVAQHFLVCRADRYHAGRVSRDHIGGVVVSDRQQAEGLQRCLAEHLRLVAVNCHLFQIGPVQFRAKIVLRSNAGRANIGDKIAFRGDAGTRERGGVCHFHSSDPSAP